MPAHYTLPRVSTATLTPEACQRVITQLIGTTDNPLIIRILRLVALRQRDLYRAELQSPGTGLVKHGANGPRIENLFRPRAAMTASHWLAPIREKYGADIFDRVGIRSYTIKLLSALNGARACALLNVPLTDDEQRQISNHAMDGLPPLSPFTVVLPLARDVSAEGIPMMPVAIHSAPDAKLGYAISSTLFGIGREPLTLLTPLPTRMLAPPITLSPNDYAAAMDATIPDPDHCLQITKLYLAVNLDPTLPAPTGIVHVVYTTASVGERRRHIHLRRTGQLGYV